jgi:hypothetical protein
MDLQEFRATRKVATAEEISNIIGDDVHDSGFIYCDGPEIWNGEYGITEISEGEYAGKFWTIMYNEDIITDTLEEAEAWLFERVWQDPD